jgi:hypothetical protein
MFFSLKIFMLMFTQQIHYSKINKSIPLWKKYMKEKIKYYSKNMILIYSNLEIFAHNSFKIFN